MDSEPLPALHLPLRFAPVYQEVVWGGRRLERWRDDLPPGPVGESWELADHPRGMSVVREGPLAGRSLRDLVAGSGEELVGEGFSGGDFPLMVKVIDARDRLSVQVHPDDRLAKEFGVGERGKTECWYLIGDGGELYQGVAEGIGRGDFERAIEEGRLAECLRRFATADGQCYFLPARTVHALGAGCLLFEIQQTSDITFRVYDWGRIGLDGKPRPLHVDESLATIDFDGGRAGPVDAAEEPCDGGGRRRRMVDCGYFRLEERRAARTIGGGTGVCQIVCVVDGHGALSTAGGWVEVGPLETLLVPAVAGAWTATAAGDGEFRLLVAEPVLG